MKESPKTIKIDNVEYVPKCSAHAEKLDGMDYVICRTFSAGVFAGYLQKRNGKEATMINARRLWYWDGAASLSQLAMEGVTKPENCKFSVEVGKTDLTEVIEVDYCTEEARICIQEVPVWKQ